MTPQELDEMCKKIAIDADNIDLDIILDTLKNRRRYLQTQKAMEMKLKLKAGDRARLDGLKPKYLNGCRVTILSVDRFDAMVEFDTNPRPTRFSNTVRIPLSCLNPTGA